MAPRGEGACRMHDRRDGQHRGALSDGVGVASSGAEGLVRVALVLAAGVAALLAVLRHGRASIRAAAAAVEQPVPEILVVGTVGALRRPVALAVVAAPAGIIAALAAGLVVAAGRRIGIAAAEDRAIFDGRLDVGLVERSRRQALLR